MGDTWIIDITHFLADDGTIAALPGPARRLAEFLAKLIVDASAALLPGTIGPAVRCRRRPGRKPCRGEIETDIDADSDAIVWWCPVCGDNGTISRWQGTIWDCTNDETAH